MKHGFARALAAFALLALLPTAKAQAPSPSIRGVLHGSNYQLFSFRYNKPDVGDYIGASGTGQWRFGYRPDIPQAPGTFASTPTGWGPDGILGTSDDWPSVLMHPIYTGDPTPPTLPASDLRWARPTPYPINLAEWPSTSGGAYLNSISTATAVFPQESLSFSASQWGGFFGVLRGSAGTMVCNGFPWSAPGSDLAGINQLVPFDRNGAATDTFYIYDLGGRPGVPASVRVLDERGRLTYHLTAPPDPTGVIPDRARGRLALRRKSNSGQWHYGIANPVDLSEPDNTLILQGTWMIVGIEGSFLDTYGGPFKASDVGKSAGTFGQPMRFFPGILYNDWNFRNVLPPPPGTENPALMKLVTYEFLPAELKISRKYDFCGNKLCYTIRNTGDVEVRNLTVTDPDLLAPVVVPGPLAPGASVEVCGTAKGLADLSNVAVVTTSEYFIPRALDLQGQTGTWANGTIKAITSGTSFVNVPEDKPITTSASSAGSATVIDPCVRIAGKVYCDNGPKNGEFDAGEGINGVSVTLSGTDIENNPVSVNVLTSGDGDYVFDNLKPGNYKVTVDSNGYLTEPAQPTAPATSTTDTEIEVPAVTPGQSDYEPNNFRMCLPASIGDYVWEDKNGNGKQDNGEPGIGGVTVELYDCNDNLVDTTVTDSDGKYLFSGLEPGDYYVKFYAPSGYVFTQKDAGGDDEKDSDADTTTGKTICTTLTPGEEDRTWDAGLLRSAKVSGYVYCDENNNKVYDAGDTPLEDVVVKLTGTDAFGNAVSKTATTGGDGKYEFNDLLPGTYTIVVQSGAPSNATAFAPTSHNVTLASGDVVENKNFGYMCQGRGQIKGILWCDADGDGCVDSWEKRLAGVTVTLKDSNGNVVATTVTDSNGRYVFPNLKAGTYKVEVPDPANGYKLVSSSPRTVIVTDGSTKQANFAYRGGCIKGLVYCDENNNKQWDCGEEPLQGVKIVLKDANGNVVDTDYTDCNGKYTLGCCLPAGTYTVHAPSSVDGKPINTTNPITVTLAPGQKVYNVNFGYKCKTQNYITYTQGGWGSKPSGNNPGMLLKNNFSVVYPAGCVKIGGSKWLKFTSASAIQCFLPQGGTPDKLTASATNPTTSSAGVFAGQVLALQLNVDFSSAGILPAGLGGLILQSGPLQGKTVNYVLSVANSVLGGGSLPSGVSSISALNDIVTKINENFNGGANLGYLK